MLTLRSKKIAEPLAVPNGIHTKELGSKNQARSTFMKQARQVKFANLVLVLG